MFLLTTMNLNTVKLQRFIQSEVFATIVPFKQCPLCVFVGIVHSCNLCDHKATQQGQLNTYQQSKHEGLRYSCKQCEYQATLRGNLKTHQQSKHEGVKYPCTPS